MGIDTAKPWNEEHGNAIVQAGFGVVFSDFPTHDQVRDLVQLHSEFRESHPRLRIAVARGWHSAHKDELPPLDGFVLDDKTGNGGVAREIKLGALDENGYALIVVRSDYTDWDAVWKGEALPIFRKCLPRIPDNLSVSRVELRLYNRFVWEADPEAFDLGKVLSADAAKWLSLGGASLGDGQYTYEEKDGPRETKFSRAGAIGVRVSPPKDPPADRGLWFDLELIQRQKVTEGATNLNGKAMVSDSMLDTVMDAMHGRCEALLGSLLNEGMRVEINLGN